MMSRNTVLAIAALLLSHGFVYTLGAVAGRLGLQQDIQSMFYAQGRIAQLEIRMAKEEKAREALHAATKQGFMWVNGVFQAIFGPPPAKKQASLGSADRG